MKAERMRGIDAAELQRQAQDAQEQLFRFRFQMGMGQLEGLKKYRNVKKERARMLTVLREKEAGGEAPAEPVAKRVSTKGKKK
jgi:large subunit ribosomal protein L29